MNFYIFLLVCAFHRINGDETKLNQAIKHGNEEIVKAQEEWAANIERLNTTFNDNDAEFKAEFNNIANLVESNADKLKAFADFKVAYEKYVTEVNNYTVIVAREVPKSISELFQPSQLAQVALSYILNTISTLEGEAAGNTCKKSSVEKLIEFTLGTVTNTTTCILKGIEKIRNFRADIDSLISYLPSIIKNATVELKEKCTEQEGTICFDKLTNETKSQEKAFKTSGKYFPQDIDGASFILKGVTGICISEVKDTFDSEVKETSEKMKTC